MKIKLSKQTFKSLKVVLILLVTLFMVIKIQQSAKDTGQSAIMNFFQTLGVTQ